MPGLTRALAGETLGTAFLLACVVGSGIMAERLCGGNTGLALLANALATGAGLVTLILTFASVSGSHFNPAVTLLQAGLGDFPWRRVPAYVLSQIVGAFAGTAVANAMFSLPLFFASQHVRHGQTQAFSEFIATFGLLLVIRGVAKSSVAWVPLAVAGYIVAAYWFTASTSFANPAVTLARAATDTFAGIRPSDVPVFIAAQIAAVALAIPLCRWMFGVSEKSSAASRPATGLPE